MSGRVDLKLRSSFKFVSRPFMENTFTKFLDTILNSAIALFKITRTDNAFLNHIFTTPAIVKRPKTAALKWEGRYKLYIQKPMLPIGLFLHTVKVALT